MKDYILTIQVMSDTTFGRGEGVAGLIDTEIEHDTYGCPFIGGRTLKGLLLEEWHTIRYALEHNGSAQKWDNEKLFLFGEIGDMTGKKTATMHIGAATLPPALLKHLHYDVSQNRVTAHDVLTSLTTIRRQTAVDSETDAPAVGSLRSERALLRTTYLRAPLTFEQAPEQRHLALLAACILATRRGGLGRNRGRGRLSMRLHEHHQEQPVNYDDETFTRTCFANFVNEVRG